MEIHAAIAAALAEDGDLLGDAHAVIVRRPCAPGELELPTIESDGLADPAAGREEELE